MSAPKTVRLTIDGRAVEADAGTNVLRAAEKAGIAIPHFCFHPGLDVEGSCRMCLVEIEGLPKLELACSTVVREGLAVRTTTERVRRARRDVLEFLLAEHPLDCPICDKAGECRLQDYYDLHGRHPGRMLEPRESRAKKVPIGRGLILDRERCVLCTRCVRFLRQVTGTGELGVFERALRSEIGIFDGTPVDNRYAGNLVDICPVGAITSEDFRFRTRAWFLTRRPSICPHCSRGCAVSVESRAGYPLAEGERRVYRIAARENPAVNGFWMCDLGREGRRDIEAGRLSVPLRQGRPDPGLSWTEAAGEAAAAIGRIPAGERGEKTAVVLNGRLTCEELARARASFVDGLGCRNIFFADSRPGRADGPLLTAERTPNLRGAVAAGFSPRLPDLGELAAARVLLVFGSRLAEHHGGPELARALSGGPRTFLFAAHAGPLDGLAEMAVPVAVPAEKSGTYINIDGLAQAFDRSLEPAPGGPAEGAVLEALARGLGLDRGGGDGR
ncbi:MAG TPA: 2Fe-2S iron-sulfur cluster-binding protein [Candidatus Aminicenantes bacterium]|nr:2Fe-2S iron-sulfur cluster-binding protein [Candidatus Aminicenantes bacterium]HRY66276.1 2Fe-2S iron-sulfur cluster-binding protein [Candidatus Aminicenantes bacterium]HRZ73204.1 2Fe-2S iron-sulfur cluster-binding protein [Candidatus Aminicenantes bacterium]